MCRCLYVDNQKSAYCFASAVALAKRFLSAWLVAVCLMTAERPVAWETSRYYLDLSSCGLRVSFVIWRSDQFFISLYINMCCTSVHICKYHISTVASSFVRYGHSLYRYAALRVIFRFWSLHSNRANWWWLVVSLVTPVGLVDKEIIRSIWCKYCGYKCRTASSVRIAACLRVESFACRRHVIDNQRLVPIYFEGWICTRCSIWNLH